MTIRLATSADCATVAALYNAARLEPLCVWNEYYPTMENVQEDLASAGLYVLTDETDAVIGALSVVPENEMDDQPAWRVRTSAREIARVVVASDHHGHGYAAAMVRHVCHVLHAEGVSAVHLSVVQHHTPARRTYEKCGFQIVGQAEMYGNSYDLMELVF